MPVHIGEPKRITGLVDEIMTSAYATSVGLLLYGARTESAPQGHHMPKLQITGLAGKVIDLVKSFMP
jgi:cell division ATPase FtsA